MKADFEVEVTLEMVNGVLAAVPHLPAEGMDRHKSVHYSVHIPNDPHAKVRIQFVSDPSRPQPFLSPFDDASGNELKEVKDSDPPSTLQRSGTFICGCFVTRGNGDKIDWDPVKNPNSGGNHVVK